MFKRTKRSQPRVSPSSVTSPTGGWNTRDSLDQMEATDALTLDNWEPKIGKITIRKGYETFSSSITGTVETLAEYHATSTRKLIAAAGTVVYDASSSTASSLGTGFTNARWQTANFNANLIMVNGADSPQHYDGSTLSAGVWSGSGLTNSNLIGVNVFKNRLFFWENGKQDFWYAAINSISGTLTKFPLSRVGSFGGNLTSMVTWTIDAGDGIDDYAVFLMSSGEAIVYQGTDPGDSAAWSLVGVYRIAPPIGIRCAIKFDGDVFIATPEDYIPLSQAMKGVRKPTKACGAVSSAFSSIGSSFGWQAVHAPSVNKLLVNVPTASGDYVQHVLNTQTGAWCRFTDIPSSCWAVYNNKLYFGGINNVYQADTGTDDDGTDISADAIQSWVNLGTSVRVSAVRPVIQTEGSVKVEFGLGYDFQDVIAALPTAVSASGSAWDTSPWDTSPWSPENVINTTWRVAGGFGQSVATRLRFVGSQSVSWLRTDYRLERGRNL